MCGFVGIFSWSERFRVTREMLGRMSARVAHRGPDGQGIYLNHEGESSSDRPQIGLAHRRLAILDPDPRADQPFIDARGRVIVFNGEIYNFRELRRELEGREPLDDARGSDWRTTCDTEVLLAAYAAWGERCVERLNGMFAFAIWDPAARQLLWARDRLGQKPLYYWAGDGAVAFASEPNALRELPWIDWTIDRGALADYLAWGCTPRGTIYESINKLMPAEVVKVGPGRFERSVYFRVNDAPITSASHKQLVSQTKQMVEQAVGRQLVSDVPLGCFLSGGMDSSVVALCMRRAVPAGQKVLTFSIGFDDPRYDETACAAAVARHLGTEHRQFIVRPNAAEDLPKLAASFGEPLGDSSALPTHYLSRETRGHVKVALSGDGGDELFGGYDRYRAMALGRRLQWMPRFLTQALLKLPGTHPKSRLTRFKRFAATLHRPAAQRYAGYLMLFDAPAIAELLGERDAGTAAEGLLANRFDELLRDGRDEVQAALAVDREMYLPEDLLTKVDRCSMLHALEVRSPFMDHELASFAGGLPADELLGGGPKRLLREAFARDLPRAVFTRAKMGFAVPIGDWFRASLRELLHDSLFAAGSFARENLQIDSIRRLVEEHERLRSDHSQRLYSLLMLELWHRAAAANGQATLSNP